jgi:phytoene dehydrogenase-like protein
MQHSDFDYDVVIVGAGMSGLAAGIRLAHFGRRVCICERHTRVGGLNSWYQRQGRYFDVGLHAMTNFVPKTLRQAPLTLLLRQLRLDYDALDLQPQEHSVVRFPHAELRFTNNPADLTAAVAALFPGQAAGFQRLVERVRNFDSFSLDQPPASARAAVAEFITDPLLTEMLFCPLMFYGSAIEQDMDFSQFCIMFRSIFLEGLCRPRQGVRQLLDLLVARFQECGGELRLGCGVKRLHVADGTVTGVELDNGTTLRARQVLSSAGLPETQALCTAAEPGGWTAAAPGQLAFVETIFVLDQTLRQLGYAPAITFFNQTPAFDYARPAGRRIDARSGVLCCPGNFCGTGGAAVEGDHFLRLTQLADYAPWMQADKAGYRAAKDQMLAEQLALAETFVPGLGRHVLATDMFTPRSVTRYTGHLNGAVYGAPGKVKKGTTPWRNLFLCGTDQGFLGIVGAMMSGVSIANLYILRDA